MKRNTRRLLSLILALVFMLSLAPAAFAAESVEYLDSDGALKSASATRVTSGMRELKDGWYYVSGSVIINGTLVISGDVKLILTDGCHLNVTSTDYRAAIQVEGEITRTENGQQTVVKTADSLTVYAQSGGASAGKLTAKAKDNGFVSGDGAGIGGRGSAIIGGTSYDAASGGNITICGGVINATSAQGAGIGGGGGGLEVVESGIYSANLTNGGYSGNVLISGGSITATSVYGAGIGSGVTTISGPTATQSNNITISGGSIKADSTHGAGIGGGAGRTGFFAESRSRYYFFVGHGGDGGNVTINGGMINASAIGGGNGGGNISSAITEALAISGNSGGDGGDGGNVTITGGVVDAKRIGGGSGGSGASSLVNIADLLYGNVLLGKGGRGGDGGSLSISGGQVSSQFIGGGGAGQNGMIALYVSGVSGIAKIRVDGSPGGNGADIRISGGSLSGTYIGGGKGGNGGAGACITVMETVSGGYGGIGGSGGSIQITAGSLSAVRLGSGGKGGNGGKADEAFGGSGGNGGVGAVIHAAGGSVTADYLGSGGDGGGHGDGVGANRDGNNGNGGQGGSGGDITISGASISADYVSGGGDGESGEQGGTGGTGGNVTISGGKLEARAVSLGGKSGDNSSASGSATSGGDGGSVTVSGGNMTVLRIAFGAPRGSGSKLDTDGKPGAATITGGSITDGKGGFPEIAAQPTDGEQSVFPEARLVESGGLPAASRRVSMTNKDLTPNNTFVSETDESGKLYLYTRDPGNFELDEVLRVPGDHDRALRLAKQLKLMVGGGDGNLMALSFLSRAELATVITRALTGQTEAPDMSGFSSAFTDIKGTWYENYVKYLEKLGIVSGYNNSQGRRVFGGGESATVAQAMKLVLYAAGYESGEHGFEGEGWAEAVRKVAAQTRTDFLIADSVDSSARIYRSEVAQLLLNSLSVPLESGETYKKTAADKEYTVFETYANRRFTGQGPSGGGSSPVDVLPALPTKGHSSGAWTGDLKIPVSLMAAKAEQTLKAKLVNSATGIESSVDISLAEYNAGSATLLFSGHQLGQLPIGVYTLVVELYEGQKLLSVFEGSQANGQIYTVSEAVWTPGPSVPSLQSGTFLLSCVDDASDGSTLVISGSSASGHLSNGSYNVNPSVLTALKAAQTSMAANSQDRSKLEIRMTDGYVSVIVVSGNATLDGDFPNATVSIDAKDLSSSINVAVSGTIHAIQMINEKGTSSTYNATVTLSGTVDDSLPNSGVYIHNVSENCDYTLVTATGSIIENEVRIMGRAAVDVTALTFSDKDFNVRWPSSEMSTLTILGNTNHLVETNRADGSGGTKIFDNGVGLGKVGISVSETGASIAAANGSCTITIAKEDFSVTISPPSVGGP